jgi:hypothetical protein
MSIKEFVQSQPKMGINDWIQCISNEGLSEYESLIISCADHMNKIIVNHEASFEKTLSI